MWLGEQVPMQQQQTALAGAAVSQTSMQTTRSGLDTWLMPGWEGRVKDKLLMTVLVVSGVSAWDARRKHLPAFDRVMARQVWGYSCGMLLFCTLQENLRAVRQHHDVWNTSVSAAVAGGLLMRWYKGPLYQRVGTVAWCLVGTTAHLLNTALQPRVLIEDMLIGSGLLDPSVAVKRARAQALQQPVQPNIDELYRQAHGRHGQHTNRPHASITETNVDGSGEQISEGISAELMQEVNRIRDRELARFRPGVRQGGTMVPDLGGGNETSLQTASQSLQGRYGNAQGLTADGHSNRGHSGSSTLDGRSSSTGYHDKLEQGSGTQTSSSSADSGNIDEQDFEMWLASRGVSGDGLVRAEAAALDSGNKQRSWISKRFSNR